MMDAVKRALVLVLGVSAMAPAGAEAASPAWEAGAALAPAGLEAATVDCRVRCGLLLGATSFTVATGTVVTWSRITGGLRTESQGKAIWTISFGTSLATAMTLAGPRRERTVNAAGIGSAVGALVGFTLDYAAGAGESSTQVAAALVGATLGALIGGAYGAFSYDDPSRTGPAMAAQRIPLLDLRITF